MVDKILKINILPTMNEQNVPPSPETPLPQARYKFRYINKSACKKFAVEFAKVNRPANKFTRVSEDFLISCEIAVKNHIQSRVKTHPSNGKTLQ